MRRRLNPPGSPTPTPPPSTTRIRLLKEGTCNLLGAARGQKAGNRYESLGGIFIGVTRGGEGRGNQGEKKDFWLIGSRSESRRRVSG